MTPAEKRARMKRGEGSPAARRPGGEPPTAGDGWGVSFRRLGGCERAAGRRVSSLASAHWRRCAISARFLAQFPFPDFCDFYSAPHETNNMENSFVNAAVSTSPASLHHWPRVCSGCCDPWRPLRRAPPCSCASCLATPCCPRRLGAQCLSRACPSLSFDAGLSLFMFVSMCLCVVV